MAVALTDTAITTVDDELGPLVLADVARAVDRLFLGVKHLSGAIGTAFTDSPTIRMGNYVL